MRWVNPPPALWHRRIILLRLCPTRSGVMDGSEPHECSPIPGFKRKCATVVLSPPFPLHRFGLDPANDNPHGRTLTRVWRLNRNGVLTITTERCIVTPLWSGSFNINQVSPVVKAP